MTVYVDNARIPWRRFRMSHLMADDPEELHALAGSIGLRREWFQPDRYGGHYDVADTKRVQAIDAGAEAITIHELSRVLPRLALAERARKTGSTSGGDAGS